MTTKLLICDDSNMARKQVARSLPDGWDVEVSFAANGAEGIEAIKAGKGDVLLLDLNMPVMDGWTFLQELEEKGAAVTFPIYIVSSSIDPSDINRANDHTHVMGFIEKPLDENKVKALIEKQ